MNHARIDSLRLPPLLIAVAVMALSVAPSPLLAQQYSGPALPREQYRSGEQTLRAFVPISKIARDSVVKLNIDGETVGLGTVVERGGLVVCKSSELRPGKLTCWLAADREVGAEVVSVNEDLDLALVRVRAQGLKPIQWDTNEVAVGQWAISPGIAETPHAVGIISAQPRRIRPQRALIGVMFDSGGSTARIEEIMAGLGAEKAGLRVGDVILSVNGSEVSSRQQVVDALRNYKEGQKVKVRVRRVDDQFDTDVLLMAAAAGSDNRANRLAGDLSKRSNGFEKAIEHDSVLQPWLCGGPLLNLDGKAVGLNIARAGRVSTYAIPAELVLNAFAELKSPMPKTAKLTAPRSQ